LRVVDSLQLTDHHKLATPANWKPGDDCVILPSVVGQELEERFPKRREEKPYLRWTADPTFGHK
jgi:peroxiredoxin